MGRRHQSGRHSPRKRAGAARAARSRRPERAGGRTGRGRAAAGPLTLADPALEYRQLRRAIDAAVARVLASGRYILGEEVDAFEREFARWRGERHVVALSNGSDALVVGLLALGVRPGDVVETTAFSFVATAQAILRVGARPRFVDIERETFNMDPGLVGQAPPAAAILPVHLFGRPVEIRSAVPVLEDGAQAIGIRVAGPLSTASFFPAKPLGACGDAGAIVCADEATAALIRRLRHHGSSGKNRHDRIGGNYRMDALEAAILRVKLAVLSDRIERRRKNARALAERLADLAPALRVPQDHPEHVYAQFVVRLERAERRDALQAHLKARGIDSEVYYPVPMPEQPCFADLGHRPGEFPETEAAAREVLALPVHPELPAGAVDRVAGAVREFFGAAGSPRT